MDLQFILFYHVTLIQLSHFVITSTASICVTVNVTATSGYRWSKSFKTQL